MAVFCCKTKNTFESEQEIEAMNLGTKLGNYNNQQPFANLETEANGEIPGNKEQQVEKHVGFQEDAKLTNNIFEIGQAEGAVGSDEEFDSNDFSDSKDY